LKDAELLQLSSTELSFEGLYCLAHHDKGDLCTIFYCSLSSVYRINLFAFIIFFQVMNSVTG
jgi:hypothetical protein